MSDFFWMKIHEGALRLGKYGFATPGRTVTRIAQALILNKVAGNVRF